MSRPWLRAAATQVAGFVEERRRPGEIARAGHLGKQDGVGARCRDPEKIQVPSFGREAIDADHHLTMPEATLGQRRHDGVERSGLVGIGHRVFQIEDDHIRIDGPAFRHRARIRTGHIEGAAAEPNRHDTRAVSEDHARV